MTAETEGLILEPLKNIQGRLARIELDIADIKVRMSGAAAHLAQLPMPYANLSSRMDRFDERLSRIERRLDLLEA